MAVDWAVELVFARGELDRDLARVTRPEGVRLLLDAVALDLERVLRLTVVRHVEGVGPRRVELHRLGLERVVDERHRDRRPGGWRARRCAAGRVVSVAAAPGEREHGDRYQHVPHYPGYGPGAILDSATGPRRRSRPTGSEKPSGTRHARP